jgi:hypothetical protein
VSAEHPAAPRYDAEGRCLDCGGVGGCHSLDCPPMAAKYDEAERSAACASPRSRCPRCGFSVRLRKDGTSMRHRLYLGADRWVYCDEAEFLNVGLPMRGNS